MANIVKRNQDALRALQDLRQAYVRLHIANQRGYLEEKISGTQGPINALCRAAFANIDASKSALEAVLNGYKIDTLTEDPAIVSKDQIDYQRLMEADSVMTRYTFMCMAYYAVARRMPFEQAYTGAMLKFLGRIGSADALRRKVTAFYRTAAPEVQATAAMAIDFIGYLERKYKPQGPQPPGKVELRQPERKLLQ